MKKFVLLGLLVAMLSGCVVVPVGRIAGEPAGFSLRDQLAGRSLVSSTVGTRYLWSDGTYTLAVGAAQDFGTWTATGSTLCLRPTTNAGPSQQQACYGVTILGNSVSLRSVVTNATQNFILQ